MNAGRTTITAEEIQAAQQVTARNLPSNVEIAFARAVLSGVFNPIPKPTVYPSHSMSPSTFGLAPFEERACSIIAKVTYRDWWFERVSVPGSFVFRVAFNAVDTASRERTVQRGRHWLLTPDMSDAEIVRTVMLAVLTAEEHEVRESFLYDGKPLFGPHFDLPC